MSSSPITSVRRVLLLTDLVDSTRWFETLGDVRAAAMSADHDRLARDLLVPWGGREIDRTDGFLLMFEQASDAVHYAIAYHRALAELAARIRVPLTARAGIHLGSVVLRENPASDVALGAKPLEVEGLAKPIAARVMSLARGGQTLVTPVVVEALTSDGSVATTPQGTWRLKGVEAPLALFEVHAPDARPMPPPPDSAKAWQVVDRGQGFVPLSDVPRALPAERDRFVGRERDLSELAALYDQGARLVSVLGPPGTGKTRLVLRYAWTWLGGWPGGAYFCDLSEARDLDGVIVAVARALDVPLTGAQPAAVLATAIRSRGCCLLILDNFEQVARYADAVPGAWLDSCPEATFLATTREVLGIRGEHAFVIDPLPRPDAIALFEARALAADPRYKRAEGDGEAVNRLLDLLDGLPLAIELAACRVRVLSTAQILARMADRFRLLSGARRDRQATLEAVIETSWEALSPWEKAMLAQLSVFVGGFGLEHVEGVIDLTAWPEAPWSVDVVDALVGKSLVRRIGERRFDLLRSIEAFAAKRLALPDAFPGSGPAAVEAAQIRHGNWLVERWAPVVDTGDASRAVSIEDEQNFLVACQRAVLRADRTVALPLMRAAGEALLLRGPVSSCVALATSVLSLPLSLPERASVHLALSSAQREAASLDAAAEHAVLAEAAFVELGDEAGVAWSRVSRAAAASASGRQADAVPLTLDALARFRRLGVAAGARMALGNLANQHVVLGQDGPARSFGEVALEAYAQAGDRSGEARMIELLAGLDRSPAREMARARFERALALHRELGDRSHEALTEANFGTMEMELGRFDAARTRWERSGSLFRQVGNLRMEAKVVGSLALLEYRVGRLDVARDLLERSRSEQMRIGDGIGVLVDSINLTQVLTQSGDAAAGRAMADAALVLAERARHPTFEALVRLAQVDLHLDAHDLDAAQVALSRIDPSQVDDPTRGEIDRVAARLLLERGDLDGATEHAERALASVADALPRDRLAALIRAAEVDQRTGRAVRARTRAAEALEVAVAAGEPEPEVEARVLLALVEQQAGDVDAANAHLVAARARVASLGWRPEFPLVRRIDRADVR